MKIEPPINHPALIQHISATYGLLVSSLTFVPKGELNLAYAVHCADGSRYFAKLMPDSQLSLAMRDNLDTYLAITTELRRRELLPSVVAPIAAADGRLRTEFAAMPLILFPYIAGDQPQSDTDGWPDQVRNQLAHDVAALHLATHRIRSPLPTTSAFDVSFVSDLERGLAALDDVGPDSRLSHQHLRDLLLLHRPALAAHLEHLLALHRAAMNKQPELVLCHTDIHELNLIIDEQGNAHILDWENVALAPAEHDLQAFTNARFADFLKVYWQAGGVRQIALDQFAFYNYRRYLVDLADWLVRILYENNDPAQDAHDLAGIQMYCLDKLVTAEDTLAEIAAALNWHETC
jgi:spectinomycin phosphotransferase